MLIYPLHPPPTHTWHGRISWSVARAASSPHNTPGTGSRVTLVIAPVKQCCRAIGRHRLTLLRNTWRDWYLNTLVPLYYIRVCIAVTPPSLLPLPPSLPPSLPSLPYIDTTNSLSFPQPKQSPSLFDASWYCSVRGTPALKLRRSHNRCYYRSLQNGYMWWC